MIKTAKKIFFVYSWLLLSTGVILTGIAGYNFLVLAKQVKQIQVQHINQQQVAISQDKRIRPGGEVKGVEAIVETQDARAEIVAQFLMKYNSPLKPYDQYGKILVKIADQHQLDFRLLPAIMMEESNLCKNIPKGSYNCLGFGIHSRGTLGFDNYGQGFARAAKTLRKKYVEQGRLTTSDIAKKYTASVDKWTNSVNQWMAEMKYNDREMGKKRKTNTNVLEFVPEN